MAETTKTRKAPARPRKTAAKATPAEKTVTVAESQAPATNGKTLTAAETRPVNISRDEIARLAHQFWAERGRSHGRHEEDWYRAERELRKRAS